MTKIEIINMALGRVGLKTMRGPDDDREEASLCNRFFDSCVAEVLDLGNFLCSMRRVALARCVDAPAFGFAYAYALPADFLHLVELDGNLPHSIENGRILTDCASCNIVYAAKLDDVSRLAPHLANCVSLLLASRIANASGMLKLSNALLGEFNGVALPAARTVDNYQKIKQVKPHYWWDVF